MGTSIKDDKSESLCTSIRKYGSDVVLLQELGNNWARQSTQLKWWARLEKQLDMSRTRTLCSHNKNDIVRSKHQWGGTGILTHGILSSHARGAGSDPSGLGRWTWARYSGKAGQVLRCVSLYRPSSNIGTKSVGAQQKRYFRETNDDRQPRQAFLEDLEEEMGKWLETGDHLVVGGDINEDVTNRKIRELFLRQGMRNLLEDRYDLSSAPATFMRNENDKVVDGIWGTPMVEIQKCGFLEAGEFPGDHATLWVDVTFNSVLGHKPPEIDSPNARRLRLFDRIATRKYKKEYKRLTRQERLSHRVQALCKSVSPGIPLTSKQAKTAEELDWIRTKCMKKAEKACRKLRMGMVEFSSVTDEPRKKIEFWVLAINRRNGVRVSPQLWKRKKKSAKIHDETKRLSLEDMKNRLKEAKEEYSVAKKDDAAARISFLDSFSKKDKDRLLRREAQRKLGRVAKKVMGKDTSKVVTSVVDKQGETHDTKEAIDAAIMPVNEAKYRSSEDSLFMKELHEEFGYIGHSEAVDKVLDGTFVPPAGLSDGAKLLLATMKQPKSVQDSKHRVPKNVSLEDHIKGWKKAKERTTAGPSGLHFGMFKANAQETESAQIDASLRDIAYSTGYVYKRWCHGVDVQILKKSKDFRIDKLRTILLLEADYNMNNKQLGRDVMWKAERDLSLARDNYGGRRCRRAAEVSLNQTLTYNSIWARRGRAVVMSNDAKGCFDRISHMVAYICLLRLGAPKDPLLSTIKTIQQLRHSIRTAFGDSEATYGGNSSIPLQGLLQGNGLAPPGWAAISAVLVEAMKKSNFGYSTWSAISKKAIEIVCFAFVDDTDLIHAINSNLPTSQLIRESQHVLKMWEELLQATGGALAPEKSYWYLVEVIRKNGSWQYRIPDDDTGQLRLIATDESGEPAISKRLQGDVSKDALGIYTKPKGGMESQVQHMKGKIAKFCDGVRTKKLSRQEAWHCLTSSIMRTLEYPLIGTTLSQSQMKKIMSPLLTTILPACGYQKLFPRKLIYGTTAAQGCGLKDPWLLQLIEHLLVILRHADRNTPTGDLLTENMELVQVHVGSEQPFWDVPFEDAGHLAPTGWIRHTWHALSGTTLKLKGPLATIKPKRSGDGLLMDVVRSRGKFSHKEEEIINNCRMHIGVACISDITTASGNHISEDAWNGSRSLTANKDKHSWPKTYSPLARDWDLWRAMLKKCLISPHCNHRNLINPLGPWYDQRGPWQWWYSHQSKLVWQRSEREWKIWTPEEGPRTNHRHTRFCDPITLPEASDSVLSQDAVRADVKYTQNGQGIVVTGRETTPSATTKYPERTDSLYAKLQSLPQSAHWAIQQSICTDNGTTVANALTNGTAVAVSDGSLKCGLGTSAFTIEGTDNTHRIHGVNKVPGPIGDGDSYRCELAGIYAIVLMTNTVVDLHDLPDGACTVACDNESSLKVFDEDFWPNPQGASFDLITAIWNLLSKSKVVWTAVHVKGHQDIKGRPLTRLEQMNVQMDRTAKAYWHHLTHDPNESMTPANSLIHEEGWMLWHDGTKVVQPSRNKLYSLLQDPTTIDWWVRHERITAIAAELIDWHGSGKSLKHTPAGLQRWTTKHASNNCGCGKTLVKWKYQDDDQCPRCGLPEDTNHILQCKECGAQEVWTASCATIQKEFDNLQTDPAISHVIMMGINAWRENLQIDPIEGDERICNAVREQGLIGWRNLLEGLWSKQWSALQRNYYMKKESRKTGSQWMAKMSSVIRRAAYKQWTHRNETKHWKEMPRHKIQEEELNRQIGAELAIGSTGLEPNDAQLFGYNYIHLLQKPLLTRQTWIVNVNAARQRAERKRTRNNDADTTSRKRSKLLHWIKSGRAS